MKGMEGIGECLRCLLCSAVCFFTGVFGFAPPLLHDFSSFHGSLCQARVVVTTSPPSILSSFVSFVSFFFSPGRGRRFAVNYIYPDGRFRRQFLHTLDARAFEYTLISTPLRLTTCFYIW